ncbi:MAG TPA: metalloregulator ArsR/SmtB family transcription factor [Planctomycetota bacterium]|jgi:ArsR family transcriptional regulator|nr:metalloregulator ArsR/SmtB family transcription factor [Planctomycetota bacterium]
MRIAARESRPIPSDPVRVLRALADPTRLRIVALLLHAKEVCGCDVEAVLGTTQSRASRHLATLRAAGVTRDERRGPWVFCRIAPKPPAWLRSLLGAVHEAAREDPETRRMLERLAKVGRSPACADLRANGRTGSKSCRTGCCA